MLSPAQSLAIPKLEGNSESDACSDAFKLANAVFYSRSPRLYAILKFPDDMNSQMVLGAQELDISGGDALTADAQVFEKRSFIEPYSRRSLYWEKRPHHQTRIVVKEKSAGWRGDMYDLFLIDAKITPDVFMDTDFRRNNPDSGIPAPINHSWRPPLVLAHKKTGERWFIKMMDFHTILEDWVIYAHTPNGYEQTCTISFKETDEGTIRSFPKNVRKFVRLLDEALGPGNNEGTLQETARRRIDVKHLWANVMLRPWALSDNSRYNSKVEVDQGLEQWSEIGPSHKAVHADIKKTYPVAEKELSDYYQKQFNLTPDGAAQLAKWVMEIAYCSNFAFPAGGNYFRYDTVDTNPWEQVKPR